MRAHGACTSGPCVCTTGPCACTSGPCACTSGSCVCTSGSCVCTERQRGREAAPWGRGRGRCAHALDAVSGAPSEERRGRLGADPRGQGDRAPEEAGAEQTARRADGGQRLHADGAASGPERRARRARRALCSRVSVSRCLESVLTPRPRPAPCHPVPTRERSARTPVRRRQRPGIRAPPHGDGCPRGPLGKAGGAPGAATSVRFRTDTPWFLFSRGHALSTGSRGPPSAQAELRSRPHVTEGEGSRGVTRVRCLRCPIPFVCTENRAIVIDHSPR